MAEAVEFLAVEHRHHALVFQVSVLDDGIVDNLSVGIDILQLVPCHILEERRHGEDGARREPAAHVVAADVVEHGVVGNLEDVVLKFLQTVYTQYLLVAAWVAEDEIAKSHVLFHQPA